MAGTVVTGGVFVAYCVVTTATTEKKLKTEFE